MIADELAGNRLRLRLDGTFDAAEAWRVHDTLLELDPGSQVSLDFSQVRLCHDFAIALLAKDLLALNGRIAVTGLCQHQRRLLSYFGADEGKLGAGASRPPPASPTPA